MKKYTMHLAAVLGAVALVASGCGAGQGTSAKTEVNTAAVAAAQKIVDEYEAPLTWKPQGPAFNIAAAKGKKYLYIANGLNLPYVKAQADTIKRELPKYGVTTYIIDGHGNADDTSKAIQQGIGLGVNLIAVQTVPPTQIQPALQAAHAAGIKIVMSGTHGDPGWPTAAEKAMGIVAQQELCQTCIGKAMAAWAVVHTQGNAHVAAYGVLNDLGSQVQETAEKKTLEELCPDSCSFKKTSFPSFDDFFNQVATQSASDLEDGKTNVLMPDYDTFSQPIMSTLAQRNAGDKVSVASSNGTPQVLKSLLNKSPLRADVAFPYTWQAWSHMDQALRILSGVAPVEFAGVPNRLLDATSTKGVDLGGSDEEIYGIDPAKLFPTLWKR